MRLHYSNLLIAAALVGLAGSQSAVAQETNFTVCPTDQAECLVEWDYDGDLVPENDALRNTIANDTDRPADRIYVLRRGGLYYNENPIENSDFDLRLIGQTAAEAAPEDNICGDDGASDCGPAVIQRVTREDGTTDARMITSSGDGNGGHVFRNIWIQGQTDQGVLDAYEPITINSSNSYFEYDNVVFDRNDWHHLGFKSGGNDVYFRNNTFRNMTDSDTDQRYGGRVVRFEAGADTVLFENNSMFNITSFVFQSEAAPVEYFVFNHNTLVNVGLGFSSSPQLWKRAYITNNLMVNPFWQGESEDIYDSPDRIDPFTGVFGITALPGRFGLEQDRRIVFANNNVYRQQELEDYYATFDPVVRAQPVINDTTRALFEAFPEFRVYQNITELDPGLTTAPTDAGTLSQLQAFIEGVSLESVAPPYANVYWDPGRLDNALAINFPRPEDFTYSNTELQSAGTDGLPLGDLNWYPDAKADYLANREAYITAIEELAGGGPREVAALLQVEAESGALADGGSVTAVEGTTDISLQTGSSTWTFDLENTTEVTVGVRALVNLPEGNGGWGVNLFLDGVQLNTQELYGETMFCREGFVAYDGTTDCNTLSGGYPLPAGEEFGTAAFTSANVIPTGQNAEGSSALTIGPGPHTLRFAGGWGGDFILRNLEILDDAGSSLVTLSPIEATSVGVDFACDEGVFCASGFQSVSLPAGASTELGITVPSGIGSAIPRMVYRSATGGTGEVFVDGVSAGTFTFDATGETAAREAVAPEVTVEEGARTVRIVATSGDLELDYVLFNLYSGGTTAVEALPEGWALGASFPNPTAGRATIRFALGAAADVRLDVFDVLGRRVSTLADGPMSAGDHEVRLDVGGLASGTYVYRLSTPVGIQSRRLTVVR